MEKVRESRVIIEHPFHPHALVLNDEEQSDHEIKQASCSACLESLSFGPSFSCPQSSCKFHLHKICAHAPLQITPSPFHCKDSSLTLKSSRTWPLSVDATCDLCKEERENMFLYICSSCGFSLDIKCALLLHNIDENFRELKHFAHQHPLTFTENIPKDDQLERAECYWCRKPLVDDPLLYACLQCRFYLHKKCAKLPTQLIHPFHRIHSFELLGGRLSCKLCQKENYGIFLRCSPCKLDIHIQCAYWPPPIIEDRPHHDHHFVRLFRDAMFRCDACGTEGNYVSYICLTCNIQVHQNCIALPHIIKITRHHHHIIHKYLFQKTEFDENKECQICFKQVKTEYGNYCCVKQDCKFVAHVKCAMENEMYDVIDQANDGEENSAMNSSITRVIESNEQGEATKIEHFSHGHNYLTLGNKIKEDDDDKRCDGCMLSISTPFYFCSQSQCEFLLHKTCAELPRKKRLWFHRPLTTLNLVDFFKCDQCYRYSSGFFYKGECDFCLMCARTPYTLSLASYQGHKHSIFFDFNFRGKYCNACGGWCGNGAFKCKDCALVLDFACITLPKTTRHKCDEHNLALAFHEENEDPKQHYCDVCEEKRDPNYWFYHCAICDNSTHPTCALGQFPFLKMGVTLPSDYYNPHSPHPLIFAKKIYEICCVCGKPCQDEVALECKDCTDNKYVIHFRCLWG